MQAKVIMRLAAIICFILAIFSVPFPAMTELGIGLALWCGSDTIPPTTP
jgi:hypothetical protein